MNTIVELIKDFKDLYIALLKIVTVLSILLVSLTTCQESMMAGYGISDGEQLEAITGIKWFAVTGLIAAWIPVFLSIVLFETSNKSD